MLSKQELVWLNALQSELALKKDWVAVGHVQALIDRIAGVHGLTTPFTPSAVRGQTIH